jgi:hypothetical protein
MSKGIQQLIVAALAFASVFLFGWLACAELAAPGRLLNDGVEWAWAVFLVPLFTLSTTIGAVSTLRLLRRRAESYGRAHFLGRVAFGAILTLLLCPFVAFGALHITSLQELDRPALVTGVLVAAGLVAGAAGLTLGLTLPMGAGQR